MADWQHAFLSKVIFEEEMKEAVNAGITAKFFRDETYQRVYEYMLQHWGQHGTPPDLEVVHQAFPTMVWKPQKQALSYLIERMRQDRKFVIVMQAFNEAAEFVSEEKPDEMMAVMTAAFLNAKLETSEARDIDFATYGTIWEEVILDRMENQGALRGISTGFDGIDYVTGGLQPEQFIVLFGTPKSFKSATLLAMAMACHEQAKVPLFVGFEMSATEQIDRLVSLLSGVALTRINRGTLSAKEYKSVGKAMRGVEAMRPFVFSTDITAGSTVGSIQAKIIDYQPDAVYVDGAYLMQSEMAGVQQGSPQALTDISRGLKRLAQSMKIPIVVTTQASLVRSKGGLSLASGMYTQAWGQDADIVLGVERQVPERPEEQRNDAGSALVKFRVIESRSGPRKEIVLEWDWTRGTVTEQDPEKMRHLLDRRANRSFLYDNDD